jgi:hypothetical protein
MDVSDVKKILQALKGAPIEGKIVGARESLLQRDLIVNAANDSGLARKTAITGRKAVEEATVNLQSQLSASAPVKVAHPFNPKEVFQFPAGTDEKQAKELVRQIITKRVKEGEEKIDLPSHLPGEKPPLDTSAK